jgi:hypothetical protein
MKDSNGAIQILSHRTVVAALYIPLDHLFQLRIQFDFHGRACSISMLRHAHKLPRPLHLGTRPCRAARGHFFGALA